ncbi:hypothetical protein V493_00935 [Pseudogymnoascus sp. VKM F-4281 (FW-2241)]|nr:hypothetical protein V493_00935 [Pseudogymnoascus sp. VKM F-4281 (FW-2241)]
MLSAEVRAEEEVGEDGLGEVKDVRRIGGEGEERFSSQDASVGAKFEELAEEQGKVLAAAVYGYKLQEGSVVTTFIWFNVILTYWGTRRAHVA